MLLIQPGKQVRIRDRKRKGQAEASVQGIDEKKLHLSLLSERYFHPGEVVEVEVPQREDAAYLIQARVLEGHANQQYILLELAEPVRIQRRRAERMPARLSVEYQLLPKKGRDFYPRGLIVDISTVGALLAVEKPLQVGDELMIIFEVSRKGFSTGLSARVVREARLPSGYEEKLQYSYGVEFKTPLSALV